jgi:predicted outer membrane repeat protein
VNAGSSVTLPGGGVLAYSGKTFTGWNTAANGSGTAYAAGAGFNEYPQPIVVSTNGRNVTVNLHSASPDDIKVIQIYSTGTLFTINNNITLKIENITLKGRSSNTASLVKVTTGGTLYIMSGGFISDNTNTSNGGGIDIDGGIVVLDGGGIYNNTSSNRGGGVFMRSTGALTIKKGEISGNIASSRGGGVYSEKCTITMNGGVIKNNSGYGIGVDRGAGGQFIKTAVGNDPKSGVIYGASAGTDLANTPGAIYNMNGYGRTYLWIGTLGEFDEVSTNDVSLDGWE